MTCGNWSRLPMIAPEKRPFIDDGSIGQVADAGFVAGGVLAGFAFST
jgi:hypothetical protein